MREEYIILPVDESGNVKAPSWYIRDRVSRRRATSSTAQSKPSFRDLAETHGLDKDVLSAIFKVESSSKAFINGRMVIRFEPHVFLRMYTSKVLNTDKSTIAQRVQHGTTIILPGMPTPSGSTVTKSWPDGLKKIRTGLVTAKMGYERFKDKKRTFAERQALEYAALERAVRIDSDIAYQSTSYGSGQVMGFNSRIVGYPSAEHMYTDLALSRENQDLAMLRFLINRPGTDRTTGQTLADAIRNKDFGTIAKLYNGDTSGRYEKKLLAAYQNIYSDRRVA